MAEGASPAGDEREKSDEGGEPGETPTGRERDGAGVESRRAPV